MGIPVSPRNIFPSNIQGLPTWYEVRVSSKGYLGRRGGVDLMVCVNPQSMEKDVASIEPGGYFVYDSTKPLGSHLKRDDITYFGIPMTEMCMREFKSPRLQQLLKNVVYVGAMAALLNIDFPILKNLLNDQFKGKEKLIASNAHALDLGYQFALETFKCPLPIRLQKGGNDAPHILESKHILMNGNTAAALGAIYGGATVAALVSDHAVNFGRRCLCEICGTDADRRRHRQEEFCHRSGRGRACRHGHGGGRKLERCAGLHRHFRPRPVADERVPGPGLFRRGTGGADRRATVGPVNRHAHPFAAIRYSGSRLRQPWRHQAGAAVPGHPRASAST
ncbi:MAG: 2-oxoacid:acceptor oxidoreductase family protein [Roseovarius sp.]|nr:2-oxoacid:acceptor oxidoreductase family protein [Roseovarius sp.]